MPTSAQGSRLVIRPMERDDLAAIHNINTDCLTISLRDHYSKEQLKAWMKDQTLEGYWNRHEAGEDFLVAARNGLVVGYCSWQGAQLTALFVSPHIQRKGIGSALVKACETRAKQKITWLKALLGASDFYEAFGFVIDREGHDVKRGVKIPHVVMRREGKSASDDGE
ncbi:GNAT family N-acetyltransferase [uncultured Cohaesibacter sp.]|uniref:GNAT family N-acetyltransferase n=1 Tax=uncultured Cohaesibacter sp. TaxID=1002546 RepID=UPI002930A6A0|nr:GNAT family N-acetyltransferase [uncultured Cohaesibacter sp.]